MDVHVERLPLAIAADVANGNTFIASPAHILSNQGDRLVKKRKKIIFALQDDNFTKKEKRHIAPT